VAWTQTAEDFSLGISHFESLSGAEKFKAAEEEMRWLTIRGKFSKSFSWREARCKYCKQSPASYGHFLEVHKIERPSISSWEYHIDYPMDGQLGF
jgi:hypothetical protein